MKLPVNTEAREYLERRAGQRYRLAPGKVLLLLAFAVSSKVLADGDISEEALDCLIEPWVVADVGSPVQGVVSKLQVDRGDNVKRGQPVAQMESEVEQAEVALAEINAAVQSEVAARRAELKLAQLELDRLDSLFLKDLLSAQARDESIARQQIAQAALTQALENKERRKLELKRSQRLYAKRILKSPVDGVIVEQLAFAGEFVYDNPVVRVAALDPLRVEVMLPARLFGSIAVGDRARVYTELDDDSPLYSTVDVVDALLDTRSATFGVRLKLPNPKFKIPAGQRCRITFEPDLAAGSLDEDSVQYIQNH